MLPTREFTRRIEWDSQSRLQRIISVIHNDNHAQLYRTLTRVDTPMVWWKLYLEAFHYNYHTNMEIRKPNEIEFFLSDDSKISNYSSARLVLLGTRNHRWPFLIRFLVFRIGFRCRGWENEKLAAASILRFALTVSLTKGGRARDGKSKNEFEFFPSPRQVFASGCEELPSFCLFLFLRFCKMRCLVTVS